MNPRANRPAPRKAAQIINKTYNDVTPVIENLLDTVLDCELGDREDEAMNKIYDAIERLAELTAIVNSKFPNQMKPPRTAIRRMS